MALRSGRFEVSVAAPLGHACENVCEVKIIIMIIKIKSSESCGLAAKRGAPFAGSRGNDRATHRQRSATGLWVSGYREHRRHLDFFFFFSTLSNLVELCVLGCKTHVGVSLEHKCNTHLLSSV